MYLYMCIYIEREREMIANFLTEIDDILMESVRVVALCTKTLGRMTY